jgi:hypothetical protein
MLYASSALASSVIATGSPVLIEPNFSILTSSDLLSFFKFFYFDLVLVLILGLLAFSFKSLVLYLSSLLTSLSYLSLKRFSVFAIFYSTLVIAVEGVSIPSTPTFYKDY